MQDGGDGQIFTADGTVDHHSQTANGGEGVNGAPVAAGAVMIEDKHRSTGLKGRKRFFFEKKNQKTFIRLQCAAGEHRAMFP
jgi:hypothetical protein